MPYGNVQRYQMGDPGRFKLSRRFRGRFKGLGGLARRGLSLVPGPVGTIAGMLGDPGPGHKQSTKAVTKHQAKKATRAATKKAPGGGFNIHRALGTLAKAVPYGQAVAQAFGGGPAEFNAAAGIDVPTLDDAAAVTGLPTTHPSTKAMHRALGGRHRRMNVHNVKALHRATRRVSGFIKSYSRTARALGLHVRRTAARAMHKRRK